MTINKLDGSRVLVVLGNKDMADFALDFKLMGFENAHSRKILLRLTRLACHKSGIDIRGKRLNVEALMMGDDCYLLVTVQNRVRRYTLLRGGGSCWRFSSVSNFLGAVEAAYRSRCRSSKSAAYEWNGAYYLTFDYPALPKALLRVLSEFSDSRANALRAAQVREHGVLLCAKNAVECIGQALL